MQCCISDWWASLWKASHVAMLLFLASFTVAEGAEDVARIFLPPSAHNSHQGTKRETGRDLTQCNTLSPYPHLTSHSSLFLPSYHSICPPGLVQRSIKCKKGRNKSSVIFWHTWEESGQSKNVFWDQPQYDPIQITLIPICETIQDFLISIPHLHMLEQESLFVFLHILNVSYWRIKLKDTTKCFLCCSKKINVVIKMRTNTNKLNHKTINVH